MTKEIKDTQIPVEAKQALGDASIKQIEQITHMVKTYYRTLFPNMSSDEYYILGMNTVLAGWNIISRSNDMVNLDVDARIATAKATQNIIQQVIEKVYCDPKVVAGMVAQATMHEAKSKLKKDIKK